MKKLWIKLLPLLWFIQASWACEGDCDNSHWAILDPKGPIAADEKHLILTAFVLMLIVVIPVIAMTVAFAWKYRASNATATYTPDWDHSHLVEGVVWFVPAVIVLVLGSLVWRSTHDLTPEKPITSAVKPLTVQVVAMNWKWLFIYPEQGIATVNQLVIPVGTPVHFYITSDSVMNSFFIPRLGGQIYAMAGMQTELNLQADSVGTYPGLSTQFSGSGFSGMRFEARAAPPQEFQRWVRETKSNHLVLDETRLKQLEAPSKSVMPACFSRVEPQLFESILQKYKG
ncbi:MAG: ubiquinol oxidase subunit II [Burkholderiales bacterium]